MTLRLSALFESQIKTVISNWKSARRRANKNKSRGSSNSPNKRIPSERTRSTGRRGNSLRNTRRIRSSEESSQNDDEDDDGDNEQPRGSQRRGRIGQTRNGGGAAAAAAAAANSSSSNRVTSSSSHRRTNALEDSQPGTSRSSRRNNANRDLGRVEEKEEDAEETASSSDTEEDDNVDDSTSEDSVSNNSGSENSEESYSPEKDRKQSGRKRHHHRHKSGRKSQQSSNGTKRRRRNPDEETDEDFALDSSKTHKQSGRRGRNAKNGSQRTVGAISQADESTQDTVSNTPKKKGRPPKNTRIDDGPSTSFAANALMLQSPSRNTRNQLVLQTGVGGGAGVGRRATENDHSYHLPVRNGRIVESDTDSREVAARPTRASVKRAIMEWARSSDIEDGEGTEEAEEILPIPTPTKSNGMTNSRDHNGHSSARSTAAAPNTVRQLRTNRNTVVEPVNDSENDSDDEPLASSQGSQQRHFGKTTSSPHPTLLQRNETSLIGKLGSSSSSSTHMTRSHATSTTSNVATSSVAPPTVHDHNYIGDVGPSTSSAANRNSRRIFSRHQRNFSESVRDLNSSEGTIRLSSETTRLRRGLPSSTTTASASTYKRENTHAEPVRRGRSRYSQENSQTEPSADDDDDEENEEVVSDMGTGGSLDSSSSDDASDSEDNQPLTSYVPKPRRGRKPGKKRRLSDDSFVADEDEEDDYNYKRRSVGRTRENSSRRIRNSISTGETSSGRNQRGSRNQKRPRYNELSDDDEYTVVANNRGRKLRNESVSVVGNSATLQDEHDASTMDSDDDQLVSVSSRGRVRKITAKARGIFKE